MTRTLGGLAPKAIQPAGNSRLMRKNRPANPSPVADPTPVDEPEFPDSRPPIGRSTAGDSENRTAPRPAARGTLKKVGASRFIPDELRAAGIDGFSALAAKLIMDGLAEYERTYNEGKPWPSLLPGEELPRGRRVR